MRKALTVAVYVLLIAGARDAAAQVGQPWTDRGYVSLNAGFESTSGEFSDARTFRLYDENGSIRINQAVDSGALFDFGAGARVWRNVSVGIAYHREATNGEGSASAEVPNPVVFNRNRSVAASVADLGRTEQAVHLQFGYMVPISEKLHVHMFLGPSFFRLKQDVIGDLTFTETAFPFTTVNTTTAVEERSDSTTGFNVGADVSYEVFRTDLYKLGVGMFIRYAGATGDIRVFDSTIGSDVGGLQLGFGGRMRF